MLGPDDPNLLKYLKQSGYEVIWGGKNDLLAPDAFSRERRRLERRSLQHQGAPGTT